MRQALNENPVVQVVMLGILGIVVAFLLMTRVMGPGDGAPSEASSAATPAAPTETAVPAPAPTETAPVTGAASDPALAPRAGFEPGEGLPAAVVHAHERGDVVALLLIQKQGTEDGKLAAQVDALRSRGDTTVFVVEANDVADYSRIASGVDLDRVPALIVIEPRRLADGELPGASVSYGFRAADSLEQAVRDVLYEGKQLPYHPG